MSFLSARAAAGLTRREVCERLRISRQTLHNWEKGIASPNSKHLPGLVALYHCSYEDLFDGKELRV